MNGNEETAGSFLSGLWAAVVTRPIEGLTVLLETQPIVGIAILIILLIVVFGTLAKVSGKMTFWAAVGVASMFAFRTSGSLMQKIMQAAGTAARQLPMLFKIFK